MKKFTVILLALAMVLSLCACGAPKEKDFIGEYECQAIKSEGFHFDPADLDMEVWLELSEEGEGVICFEEEEDLEWSIEDEATLLFEIDGEEYEAEFEEGVIILEVDEIGTMWFVGDDGELPEKIAKKVEEFDPEALMGGIEEEEEAPVADAAKPEADAPVDEQPEAEAPVEEAPEPEAPVAEETPAVSTGAFEPVSAQLGNYLITIQGAEHVLDIDDKDAIRIYYDFTNLSEETEYASSALDFYAEQDGYELNDTYCSYEDDAAEYGNDMLYVRPGVTIRCVEEISMKADGGVLTVEIEEWYSDDVLSVEFDPANLPGAPATPLEIAPVMEPTWTSNLYDGGYIDDGHYLYIDTAEEIDDYGDKLLRVYFEFTNNGTEATSPWMETYIYAYQDGIQLDSSYYQGAETDDLYMEDINPGETVYFSICYYLRNTTSPVEVECNCWDADNVGCYFAFN